ncbi:MAG: hypothetical protein IPK27_12620 [Rhodanobacteraceae bacterium]|nr:hypothetical protein [Rhodanobacteraceae bacterium]
MRKGILGGLLLALAGCAQQPVAPVADAPADAAAPVLTEGDIERTTNLQDLPTKQPIRIDNPYGDVRVRFGGYEHKLEWRTVAQNGAALHKIGVTGSSGAAYSLVARLPEGVVLAPGQRVEITAYVPQGHDLEIVTERGLIDVRGLQGNLKARSAEGSINFRGIAGLVDVETGAGMVEGQLDPAPMGSRQRIATSTGNILLGIVDGLNARLAMASSGVFATEFSVEIVPQPGQEPNKSATAEIGKPESDIEVVSKRGEIRLLRRLEFRPA